MIKTSKSTKMARPRRRSKSTSKRSKSRSRQNIKIVSKEMDRADALVLHKAGRSNGYVANRVDRSKSTIATWIKEDEKENQKEDRQEAPKNDVCSCSGEMNLKVREFAFNMTWRFLFGCIGVCCLCAACYPIGTWITNYFWPPKRWF